LRILNGLKEIAKEIGYTQAQVALAWTIANNDTSTCIFGASNISQLEDNLKCLELLQKWDYGLEEKCNKMLNNAPTPSMDFSNWQPREGRRSISIIDQAKKKAKL